MKKNVLTIAGHDPSGGAGISADILTINTLDAHACSCISSETVQNSHSVKAIYPRNPKQITEQLTVLNEDFTFSAIKIGLIGSNDIAIAIQQFLHQQANASVIIDPILRSGTGTSFLPAKQLRELLQTLYPYCTLLTPNGPELKQLGQSSNIEQAINSLYKQGCSQVLLTGGHENSKFLSNRLFINGTERNHWDIERIKGEFHGTGCTLSSAIATFMAQGDDLVRAIEKSQDYLSSILKSHWKPGKGQSYFAHLNKP